MPITPLDILHKNWGYTTFRSNQKEIVESALRGENLLAILPTGAGKSICFQVPALCVEGLCLVVSPLISLMKDQVETLKAQKIKAEAIYTGLTKREIDVILDNASYGDTKFLYVSPERLYSSAFLERLSKMKINFLVIDEAHCISQWGYDFRPAYLKIAEIRQHLPEGIPMLAFTASATKEVKEDILSRLQIEQAKVFRGSFLRPNLSYSVFLDENKYEKTLHILSKVQGSSVVYVSTRKHTVDVAKYLHAQKIGVDIYHAGLNNKERELKQKNWKEGKTRVIVATNAFGMGINKPDVRTVIHFDVPTAIEAYYQEAGRAGRDGKKAYAIALYDESDIEKHYKNLETNYPEEEYLRRIYQALANFFAVAIGGNQYASYDFNFEQFIERYSFKSAEAFRAIQLLEKHGFVKLTEGFYEPSKLKFNLEGNDLYRFQVANPMFDEFIKHVLRIYGATGFGHYTKVDEERIATKAKTNVYEVRKKLMKLSKLGVVHYLMQKDKPQLTFMDYRYDAQKLPLNFKVMQRLKAQDSHRLDEIAKYLNNNQQCRSYQLAAYFDEYLKEDCGICDVCVAQSKA